MPLKLCVSLLAIRVKSPFAEGETSSIYNYYLRCFGAFTSCGDVYEFGIHVDTGEVLFGFKIVKNIFYRFVFDGV